MPLAAHPNDPAPTTYSDSTEATGSVPAAWTRTIPQPGSEKAVEFLTTLTITVPEGTPSQSVEDTTAREAQRAHELAEQGYLVRLWMLPGEWRALGLWQAQDATEREAMVKSLPLDVWVTIETAPLTQHPNDPAIITSHE